MKKIFTLSVIMITMLVLAGCGLFGSNDPTPTPEVIETTTEEEPTDVQPTEEPAPEPTEEPMEEATEAPAEEPTEEPAEETAAVPNWEPVGCETFGIDAAIAGALECGTVTVPENRASGSEATIRLAVARVPTDAQTPGTPVIEGTGGPGQKGFGDANPQTLGERAAILADRDWILFSQRGTEFSEPFLNCPDYNNSQFEGGINGWTNEELHAYQIEAMQTCVDDFRAQGVDLSAYNSNENAADINDIRQALGYDQIIYFGESYGTLLGQFLLRNHPDILEAMIIDGVVPVEFELTTDVTDIPRAFERIFDGCANDAACSSVYPNAREDFAAAIDNLRANPPTLEVSLGDETVEMEVDSTLALNAMFIGIYGHGYSALPSQVNAYAEGDYSALRNIIPQLFSASDNARVQHFAINCSDDPVSSLDEIDLEDLPDYYQEIVLDDAWKLANFCPMLDLPQLDAASDEPLTADVPVLLLQGGYDPATPVEGGNLVAEALPKSTNAIFPAGTHIQVHDPCALSIMDAFMTDPTTAPDTSCINQEVTFAVPLDATITSTDGDQSLSLTLAPGYLESDAFGPLQVFSSGQTKQIFGTIWDAGEQPDAGSSLQYIVDEILPWEIQESEFFEGDPVAGYPTQRLQAAVVDPAFGIPFPLDGIAFENEGGRIFSLIFVTLNPGEVEALRGSEIPATLETVSVGGGG